jgi:hypothetical protein
MNLNTEDSTLIGKNPAVYEKVEIRIKYAEKYTDFWRNVQTIAEKYYNKKYKKIFFALDDKILLNIKNFIMRKLYKKFSDRYVESFQILKKIGMNVYQLDLFKKYGRLHRIFYISLLKLYTRRPGVAPTEFIDVDGEE